jgi:hypothetical protein
MVASVTGLTAATLVAVAAPASAATVDLVVDYICGPNDGSIADAGTDTVNLKTRVTIPTTLNVGDRLNIGWNLHYKGDGTRFGSPDYFAEGARVTATGTVRLSGGWNGTLKPTGALDQPNALQPGTPLKLPELMSDSAATDRAAEVRVKPGNIVLDFTPPAGKVVVNDDAPDRVQYFGTWGDYNDRGAQMKDVHNDVHATEHGGAGVDFTFTGTGVDLIGELDYRGGPAHVQIDGHEAAPSMIDFSKDESGNTVTYANDGGHNLLRLRGLSYGTHHLTVTNLEDGKWSFVDAFRVITKEMPNAPRTYRATCVPVGKVNPVILTIGGGDGGDDGGDGTDPSGSPSPSATPTGDGSESPTPTGGYTPPGGTVSPTPTPTHTPTPTPTPQGVITTVTATATASVSPKATQTVMATVTASPQVRITPVGGAHTGEAPDPPVSPGPLLAAGILMVAGSGAGGLVLRRRRSRRASSG